MSNVICKKIKIDTEYITLGQFLKFTNVITNGGEAKEYINFNEIIIDNELVKARGKKLYPGSKININDSLFFEISK